MAVLRKLKIKKVKLKMSRFRKLSRNCSLQALILALAFLIFNFAFCLSAQAARVKDLGQIEGFRANQLFGFGLVAGLTGTGDKQNTEFTVQTLANLLQDYNIRVNPNDVQVKNVAAVMVTAEVPAFVQPGTKLDATISSVGDAASLSGGILLLTPLKGPDGKVYAVAQGPVSLGGGYTALGVGAKISKDHQTAGRITAGVLLERAIPSNVISQNGQVMINLSKPDFTTARRMSEALNRSAMTIAAQAISPGVIAVDIPENFKGNPIGFISALESIEVAPDNPARIVVNERTGTVIIDKNVRIAPVAVAHAGLHITIKTEQIVSQPNPFGTGQTVVVPDTTLTVKEPERRQLIEIPGGNGISLSEIVQALNSLGVTPRDLIAVFEALREAGALQAELVVM
jgi:flagellar P-ring protein precursor FlgI